MKLFRDIRAFCGSLSGRKKYAFFAAVFLLIALLLELFVFNFRHWQSLGYEPLEIKPLTMDKTVSKESDNVYYFKDDDTALYFSEFDVEVKNICVDVETIALEPDYPDDPDSQKVSDYYNGKNAATKIHLLITDDANYYGLDMPDRTVVSTVERTKYIALHLAGNSTYLRLSFPASGGEFVQLNRVVLNARVPLFFSPLRCAVVFFLMMLLFALRPGSELHRIALNWHSLPQKAVICLVLAAQIALSMGMTTMNVKQANATSENASYLSINHEKRYILLADALLDGRLYVDYDPGVDMEDIEALEDPYDPVLLAEAGSRWNDYAYYNGKYYVYFGVVPCLLFNIPVKLLTGQDIMAWPCIMALLPFFAAAGFYLIYEWIRRFTPKRADGQGFPLTYYLLLSLLFVNGCGLGSLYGLPDAYRLPIFTGLFFAVLGLALWVGAVRTDGLRQRLSGGRLFFGSLCMALTGGCRPQFLIALFLAVPLFWNSVFRDRLLLGVHSKEAVKNTLLFAVPIVLVAAGLMWYNRARFGSPFDFGANYNQTNNDMTVRGFAPYRLVQGIFYYLLQPPSISEIFPYFGQTSQNTPYTGVNIILESAGGLLWMQPAVWCLLLAKPLRAELKERGMRRTLVLLLAFAVIVPCVDSAMAGIVDRYNLDFYWMTALASAAVLACALVKYENTPHEAALQRAAVGLMPATVIISVLLSLSATLEVSPVTMNPTGFYGIQSLVEFWY